MTLAQFALSTPSCVSSSEGYQQHRVYHQRVVNTNIYVGLKRLFSHHPVPFCHALTRHSRHGAQVESSEEGGESRHEGHERAKGAASHESAQRAASHESEKRDGNETSSRERYLPRLCIRWRSLSLFEPPTYIYIYIYV